MQTSQNQIKTCVGKYGNYLCKNDNFAADYLMASESFDLLSKLVSETYDFQSNNDKQPLSKIYHSTTTSLVLIKTTEITNKKNKQKLITESFNFNIKNHPADTSRIRRIYDSVLTSAVCE